MQGYRLVGIIGALTAIGLALFLLLRSPDPVTTEESGITATIPPTEQAVPESLPAQPLETVPEPIIEATAADVDQPVPSADGISLRGWVGTADGTGLAGIEIGAESHGFDGEEIIRLSATSNGSGEFELQNIVPGRQYKLEIKPQASYAAYSVDSFTSDTAQELLQKIVLQRVDLVEVEGMIVDTNLAPIPDFELSVRSLAVEFPDRVIRSDSTGYFKLSAFPAGELRIATNASDYYDIKGLALKPDEYQNLTLMIDRGNYHLSGWVGDDNGAPLAQVQVTLKSAFAADGYHSFSYRSAVTDDNGAFEFDQLGGHPLTLGIYAAGFESLIQRHEFESFSDRVEIRLRPGG